MSGLISVLLCPSLVLCYERNLANLRSSPTNFFFFWNVSFFGQHFPQILFRLRVKSNNKTMHFTVHYLIFFRLIDINLCFLKCYKFPGLLSGVISALGVTHLVQDLWTDTQQERGYLFAWLFHKSRCWKSRGSALKKRVWWRVEPKLHFRRNAAVRFTPHNRFSLRSNPNQLQEAYGGPVGTE